MGFKKMCNLVGIDPLKRIKLMKLMSESLKKKEGETNPD